MNTTVPNCHDWPRMAGSLIRDTAARFGIKADKYATFDDTVYDLPIGMGDGSTLHISISLQYKARRVVIATRSSRGQAESPSKAFLAIHAMWNCVSSTGVDRMPDELAHSISESLTQADRLSRLNRRDMLRETIAATHERLAPVYGDQVPSAEDVELDPMAFTKYEPKDVPTMPFTADADMSVALRCSRDIVREYARMLISI